MSFAAKVLNIGGWSTQVTYMAELLPELTGVPMFMYVEDQQRYYSKVYIILFVVLYIATPPFHYIIQTARTLASMVGVITGVSSGVSEKTYST